MVGKFVSEDQNLTATFASHWHPIPFQEIEMSNSECEAINTVERYVTPAAAAEAFPNVFPAESTVKYYMRPGPSKSTGFDRCIVVVGPKKRLIDLHAIPGWLESRKAATTEKHRIEVS